jgi:hypothetical protein
MLAARGAGSSRFEEHAIALACAMGVILDRFPQVIVDHCVFPPPYEQSF